MKSISYIILAVCFVAGFVATGYFHSAYLDKKYKQCDPRPKIELLHSSTEFDYNGQKCHIVDVVEWEANYCKGMTIAKFIDCGDNKISAIQ